MSWKGGGKKSCDPYPIRLGESRTQRKEQKYSRQGRQYQGYSPCFFPMAPRQAREKQQLKDDDTEDEVDDMTGRKQLVHRVS
jgi:hypothetical protein